MPLLKQETEKFLSLKVKTQLEGSTNVQLLLTHYLTLQFRFPSTIDLHFALLSEILGKIYLRFL